MIREGDTVLFWPNDEPERALQRDKQKPLIAIVAWIGDTEVPGFPTVKRYANVLVLSHASIEPICAVAFMPEGPEHLEFLRTSGLAYIEARTSSGL